MSFRVIRQLLKGRHHFNRTCCRLMSSKNEEKDNVYLQRQEGVLEYMPDDRDFEGGTHVNMLSESSEDTVYILKFSSQGFTLKSGLKIEGPCIFFPRSFLSWKISGAGEVNRESLSLFSTIHPKPDLVVLGLGNPDQKMDPSVIKYLREKKINFEILPTEQAIATFNFLNAEQRWVAAGMIPPTYTPSVLREEMQARLTRSTTDDYLTDDDEEEDVASLEMEQKKKEVEKKLLAELPEVPKTNLFGFPILKPALDMAEERKAAERDTTKVVSGKRDSVGTSEKISDDKSADGDRNKS